MEVQDLVIFKPLFDYELLVTCSKKYQIQKKLTKFYGFVSQWTGV